MRVPEGYKEMCVCSEKSIRGLSRDHRGTKSREQQSLSSASLWPGVVSPHSDLQEKTIHHPVAPEDPAAFTKDLAGAFPGVPQSRGPYFTPPESLAQQADFLLPPSGQRSAQAGGHLPKTIPPSQPHTAIPHCTPFSKHLEPPGVAQVAQWRWPRWAQGGDGEQRL